MMTSPFDRVVVITCRDKKGKLVASHGVDFKGNQIVLPTERPEDLGAIWDEDRKEWFIKK